MTLREFNERAEQYVIRVIGGPALNRVDHLVRTILFILSRLYRAVVQLRLSLYRERILRHHTLGCLVVSIGNLTVGGTGKIDADAVAERYRNQ